MDSLEIDIVAVVWSPTRSRMASAMVESFRSVCQAFTGNWPAGNAPCGVALRQCVAWPFHRPHHLRELGMDRQICMG